jgi:hypothetical protein
MVPVRLVDVARRPSNAMLFLINERSIVLSVVQTDCR